MTDRLIRSRTRAKDDLQFFISQLCCFDFILTFLHCQFDALCHHFNKAFVYVCMLSIGTKIIDLESSAIAKMTARCAMRTKYECPENFRESRTMPSATFPEILVGFSSG